MQRRCGIYVRVSSMEQAGGEVAFAAQKAAGIALCKENGWRFEVFRETGLPGAVLRKLVKLAKAGTINYVFVHGWDRLSRNLHQAMAVKEEIERGGARIVTSAGQAFDAMIADMVAMFHRFERSCMAERRRWALARRRNRR